MWSKFEENLEVVSEKKKMLQASILFLFYQSSYKLK